MGEPTSDTPGKRKPWHTPELIVLRRPNPHIPTPNIVAESSGRPKTVLLALGQGRLRHFLARALSAEGFAVLYAATGAELLARAEQRDLDLVLLDVTLPDASGCAVCRDLKAADAGSTKVILFSDCAQAGGAKRASEAGADGYFGVPCSALTLLATVCRLLAG